MRLLLTGGGTGGHVIPNIALIEELKQKHPEVEIHYIGEKNSIEEKLIRAEKIPFYAIRAGKLRRYWSIQNITDLGKTFLGVLKSIYLLLALKPDVIFAKGGFVSLPVGCAAWILRKKLIVHESDVSPGLSVRIMSLFAKKVLVSHEKTYTYFAHAKKRKCAVVGNPVRKSIMSGKKEAAKRFLGWKGDKTTILVMGGSMGAKVINDMVETMLEELTKKYRIIHLSGKHYSNKQRTTNNEQYRRFEYIADEMKDLLALADVVVTRAGANTVSEMIALQKKCIFIPLPTVGSRGEQKQNAERVTKHGAGVLIEQKNMTPKKVAEAIESLLTDKKYEKKMTKIAKEKEDSIARILSELGIHE